jgi:hypothetical protein
LTRAAAAGITPEGIVFFAVDQPSWIFNTVWGVGDFPR